MARSLLYRFLVRHARAFRRRAHDYLDFVDVVRPVMQKESWNAASGNRKVNEKRDHEEGAVSKYN
jgi:hypothetical protein